MDKIEQLLIDAYKDLENGYIDDAMGCIAEALARVQGDTGSFDNQEGI